MPDWISSSVNILIAAILIILNGFFVAAEFALVKVRLSRIDAMINDGRPFAKTARWLAERLDRSLSCCQLGITMASLGLGWVGEPAFAHLLEPMFRAIGIESSQLIHGLSFAIAFGLITALHLVIGEQFPKIFAIRKPEIMILWCAVPLKFFYVILFPFVSVLDRTTTVLLRMSGVDVSSAHGTPHTEDEIRALLREAHIGGELSRSEHRLLNAVFEFDDIICRRVMVPRSDVVYFELDADFSECVKLARRTRHTRYPLVDGSLDKVLGVVHIKDFIGIDPHSEEFRIESVMRKAQKVPENMPISVLLRHFQRTHQLLAFVVDEYGNTLGVVTLENVLERIVGPVDDEFDVTEQRIIRTSDGRYLVLGNTPIEDVEREFNLNLDDEDVDTVAGVIMTRSQKIPVVGDTTEFAGAIAEIIEVKDDRATKIMFTLLDGAPHENDPEKPSDGNDAVGGDHDEQ